MIIDGDGGNNILTGSSESDRLTGGLGDDTLDGAEGTDTAVLGGRLTDYRFAQSASTLISDGPDGHDIFSRVEFLQFDTGSPIAVGALYEIAPVSPMNTVSRGGISNTVNASPFSGAPIPGVQIDYEFLGAATGEIVFGTNSNDFINLLAGDDAADGGAGNDILDGGVGSNFLSGGTGTDTFFLDGRGGSVTWATITDWSQGEQLSVWGWKADSKVIVWREDGAEGFKGITMHADLNNDGTIDTSVTWSGKTQADLPTPSEFPAQELLWFT